MNISRVAPWFFFFLVSNPSPAAESNWSPADAPTYLKVGAAWDMSNKYTGTTLEIQSPGLAYQAHATHEFNVIATLSSMNIDNMILDDESNKYKTSYNSTESIGLGWRVSSSRAPLAAYLQLGAIHLDADKKLAQFDHQKWGTRFTFGVEYPMIDEASAVHSSFFIQETSVSGLGRANQFAHDPDVFNGTTLSFGARVWI